MLLNPFYPFTFLKISSLKATIVFLSILLIKSNLLRFKGGLIGGLFALILISGIFASSLISYSCLSSYQAGKVIVVGCRKPNITLSGKVTLAPAITTAIAVAACFLKWLYRG